MTKGRKIELLDELHSRVDAANRKNKEMKSCEDDTKTLIRNLFGIDSHWLDRIDQIRWSPGMWTDATPDSTFERYWNNGKLELAGVINSIRSEIETFHQDGQIENNNKHKIETKKIFIVHGHNNEMKLSLARTIEKLGLVPVILHEQPNRGRTIIEKFERLSHDVGFAVVLLSADDLMDNGAYRARQNVILELGYFIAKLGRENVVALYDTSKEVEIPSDISGVLYEAYDNPNGVWRFELVQELNAAGYEVDAKSLTK